MLFRDILNVLNNLSALQILLIIVFVVLIGIIFKVEMIDLFDVANLPRCGDQVSICAEHNTNWKVQQIVTDVAPDQTIDVLITSAKEANSRIDSANLWRVSLIFGFITAAVFSIYMWLSQRTLQPQDAVVVTLLAGGAAYFSKNYLQQHYEIHYQNHVNTVLDLTRERIKELEN